MRVKIIRSPNPKKKFRATLEDGRTVDFGASGYSDYTKHKNPSRMRSYVLRHGGSCTQTNHRRTRSQEDPNKNVKRRSERQRELEDEWYRRGWFLVPLVPLEFSYVSGC